MWYHSIIKKGVPPTKGDFPMYDFRCSICKPDRFGNCPCDYGFLCPSLPYFSEEEEEEEEEPPPLPGAKWDTFCPLEKKSKNFQKRC
jgi:hypothetical protein